MYIQIISMEVQAGKNEALLAEARANARASRQEAGVIQFDVLQQSDDPNKFVLYEVYRSAEDAEAHRQTSHFKRWLEAGVPLLKSERMRQSYQEIEVD